MREEPLISVCIANYNGVGVIDDCIRSVLEASDALSIEIIVHDDASTDGSAEYIGFRYPEVQLVASQDNVGYCVSNNRMVARSSGRYVLLLNNDAALHKGALTCLLSKAEASGKPVILGLPEYEWESGRLHDIGSLLDPFLNAVPNLDPDRGEVAMVAGACLWIPRSLWDELGGFPEWFGSVGEDLYLCCRARLAGYSVWALGESGFRHRIGQSFGGGKTQMGRLATTFRRRALSERNKTFVMAMTYPSPIIFAMLPLHLILLILEGILLSVLKGNLGYLQDIYLPVTPELTRHRVEWMRARRVIQSSRAGTWRFFSCFSSMPYKLGMLLKHGLPEVS
jgi:GT2 family glycosyltransferase